MLVICPSCLQKNILDNDQLVADRQCVHCVAALSPSWVVELDTLRFKQLITQTQALVLVVFGAPSCGSCQAMAFAYQHIAKLYSNLCCAKVDTEAEPQLAAFYQIKTLPSLLLFRHNQLLAQIAGAMNTPQIKAWLAHHGVHH